MHILTVSNCPALDHLGSGYIIANFVKGMRTLGHEVDLLQPKDYEICQLMHPRANSYRQAIGMLFAVKQAIRVKNYDLIEFWGGEAWLATQWLFNRVPRPVVVQHTNGPEPRYNHLSREAGFLKLSPPQHWYAEKLMIRAFNSPDAIVTVSEYDRIWLAQHGLPPNGQIKAIENPLPDCFLGRPSKPRHSRVIGFCGTWLPKKGIGVLVTDITKILREFPEWRFLVLGTNPSASVQSCFPIDVRQRIEVMPIITEKESLAQQYEKMEIFVLPSFIESFGIALAEAMACGCSVVTTRVGLGASLVDGRDAILLEKPESPHLYESVKRLILNPDLRRQVGIAARERVQSLRWDRAIPTLSDTYEGWLADYRRAAGQTTRQS